MRNRNSKMQALAALAALTVALFLPEAARAHEGHQHQAMGTIKMLHENHLVLTLADAKEEMFVLSEKTKYLRGESAAKREELVAGERAVVTYEKKDGANLAIEVKLAQKKP